MSRPKKNNLIKTYLPHLDPMLKAVEKLESIRIDKRTPAVCEAIEYLRKVINYYNDMIRGK